MAEQSCIQTVYYTYCGTVRRSQIEVAITYCVMEYKSVT